MYVKLYNFRLSVNHDAEIMGTHNLQRIKFEVLKNNPELFVKLATSESFELVINLKDIELLQRTPIPTPENLAMQAIRNLIKENHGKFHYKEWLNCEMGLSSSCLAIALIEVIYHLYERMDFLTSFAVNWEYDMTECSPISLLEQNIEHRIYKINVQQLQKVREGRIGLIHYSLPNSGLLKLFENRACNLLGFFAESFAEGFVNELARATYQIADYDYEVVKLYTEEPAFSKADGCRDVMDGEIYYSTLSNGKKIRFITLWESSVWITTPQSL